MAQQDNALQAPASGFGQEVSFSFRPNVAQTPQIDGLGRDAQGRSGVQGSPVAGSVQQAQLPEMDTKLNPTFLLLQKAAGVALEKRIKEEKAAGFVRGMQRAASGEAIKDIAEGQPWYSRIFGESDVVEGARVYTAQARAAEAAGAIEDNMAEVRKMDPTAAQSYYSQLIAKHMTGDDVADAAIMQGFARTMPATMRRQAKEHYAWRQEEASKAESSAFMSNAALLQKRAASDKQTDDEYAANAVQFYASMRPAVGRDVESWTKARTQDLLNLAQSGQFHAINTIRASGLMNQLSPEQRTRIESALDTAENRTIATKSFEYAAELGRIAGEAEVYHDGMSPADTYKQLAALNERMRKETGIDRDLISLDKGTGIIKDVHSTLLKEGERRVREAEQQAKELAKAGDKARAEQIERDGAMKAISIGNAAGAARALPDGVVHSEFYKAYTAAGAAGGAQAQAQLLMSNYAMGGYVHPDIKKLYETRAAVAVGAAMPDDFLQLHEQYVALKAQNPAAADAYFGKMADRMAMFDAYLVPGKPGSRNEAVAYVATFGTQEPPRPIPLDKKERAAVRDAMTTQHSAKWWNLMGQHRVPLRADQADQALTALEPTFEKFRRLPGLSLDDVVRRGTAHAERESGSEILGGFFVRGNAGQQPLSSILREYRPGDVAAGTGEDASDYWDTKLKGVIEQRAQRLGVSASDPIAVIRNPDTHVEVGGKKLPVAWLDVYYTAGDGRQVPVRISSQDIKNFAMSPTGRKVGGVVTN